MYEELLIPTDGSEGTRGAVAHGLALADQYGATVHALSVANIDAPMGVSDKELWDAVFEDRERRSEQATAAVAETAGDAGVGMTKAIREGDPAEEIVAYTEQQEIDLIAMGTHGRTGLSRYLLGSVTTNVVRTAPVPVLTVQLTEQPTTTAYTDILVATDGTAGSAGAIEHAIDLASRYGATLHALYVVDSKFDTALVRSALENEGERAVRTVASEAPQNVSTVERVVTGVPHEEILGAIEQYEIDLLAIGTHGRTGIDRLLLGSVAERLIRTAEIPVLTVRAAEDAEGS